MALKLGICTRYYQHEITRAGIQLAEMATDSGIPASIKAMQVCSRDVSPRWDAKVVSPRVTFDRWATDLTHILWTECPPVDAVRWARDNGIVTWLLGLWDELEPEHRGTVHYFDKVITPYACMHDSLKRLRAVKAFMLPWDNMLPSSVKTSVRSGAVRILVPLSDGQAERIDLGVFMLVAQALAHRPQIRFTFIRGRNWARRARKRLQRLKIDNPRRVTVVFNPSAAELAELYTVHDLTLWLTQWEGLAVVGQDSLKMGTPVIAWANDPQIEYLQNNVNAQLVPCEIQYNWLGMGEVVPNYEVFLQRLLETIDNDALRAYMQDHVLVGSLRRHEQLRQRWAKLWQ